jgi:hypothetical protein
VHLVCYMATTTTTIITIVGRLDFKGFITKVRTSVAEVSVYIVDCFTVIL